MQSTDKQVGDICLCPCFKDYYLDAQKEPFQLKSHSSLGQVFQAEATAVSLPKKSSAIITAFILDQNGNLVYTLFIPKWHQMK